MVVMVVVVMEVVTLVTITITLVVVEVGIAMVVDMDDGVEGEVAATKIGTMIHPKVSEYSRTEISVEGGGGGGGVQAQLYEDHSFND